MNWQRAWRQRLNKFSGTSRRRFNKVGLISKIAVFVFVGVVAAMLGAAVLFAWYAKDLPRPDRIVRREGFATKIYDRHEELLYDVFADQRRTPVSFDQIPDHLKNAAVAIEDKNFYKHAGFDITGYFRAVYNIIVHHKLQGGSTLTQQLVKNVLLTSQRTLPRKIKEFILAVQIESKYSKDEILQMYLNESPFGGTAWGVQAAAETYFGKDVAELNLVESALLAGLPQRPSVYSPFSGEQDAWVGRTQAVLRRMREDGYITADQEQEAKEQLDQLEFADNGGDFRAPHFVMYVKQQLEERYGQRMVEQGGLRVYTTLDWALQEKAQQIVSEEIKKVESLNITNGAAVVIDPQTGEILAMIGSKNYDDPDYDGKVNVTLSQRQPGSAIKPVTYVTALKKGYTAATLLMDTPVTFLSTVPGQKDYAPVNYDGQFHGPVTLRFALGNSLNVPAVKMLAKVGLKDMLTTAWELGLSTLEPTEANMRRFGLSVTLGGGEVRLLELAEAYSAFANGGLKVEPVAVLKVTDSNGKVLDEYRPMHGKAVLTLQEAFLVSHILSDHDARVLTFGDSSYLDVAGRTVAAKTGTTNDKRDNWTIGWTPQVMVGVWVGNNDNSQMTRVASGVSGASPIWHQIIVAALGSQPVTSFAMPEGMVTAEVDQVSGFAAHDGYPSRVEYFLQGTQPVGKDLVHTKLKLCRGQDKLASPAQAARGDYEEKEYFVFEEEDPVSQDGINRWQQGIDEWLAGQGDSRNHPPTEFCGDRQEMALAIEEPSDHQQVDQREVRIQAKIISDSQVERVEFLVDGSLKDTLENGPWERVVTLSDGPHTLKVKARNQAGKEAEAQVKIGVKVPWDWQPSPTPTPTLAATPTPTPTPTLTPSPTPTIP